MTGEWVSLVGPVMSLVAAVSGIVGVVVGHWLNRGHTHKEKIKDLRREAYGVILAELAAAQPVYDAAVEAINEDAHGYHSSERRDLHLERISGHIAAARQRFIADYLILSDQFIERFERMQRDRSEQADDMDPFNNVEIYGGILRDARPKLLSIARREVA